MENSPPSFTHIYSACVHRAQVASSGGHLLLELRVHARAGGPVLAEEHHAARVLVQAVHRQRRPPCMQQQLQPCEQQMPGTGVRDTEHDLPSQDSAKTLASSTSKFKKTGYALEPSSGYTMLAHPGANMCAAGAHPGA